MNKRFEKLRHATFSLPYLVLTVIFCVTIILANLMEIKTLDAGWFTLTAGIVVFPITYIINDCVVEIYGLRRAKLMIWLGFGMALAATLMLQLAIELPGGRDWTGQDAMETVYGTVPRIMAGSLTAFVAGSLINALVMAKMRHVELREDRRSYAVKFSIRAIVSTIAGEATDSVIFFPIAFGGLLPTATIVSLIVSQTLLKTLYEILILPVTLQAVNLLRKAERKEISEREGS